MLTSPFTNRTQGSKPSAQILKAAKTAANSPHALINLTRLIKSLDSKIPVSDPDDSPLIEISGSVVQRRKDWESLMYARAALDLMREGNEGSSSSSRIIEELTTNLNGIITRYEATVAPSPALSSRPVTPIVPPPSTFQSLSTGQPDLKPRVSSSAASTIPVADSMPEISTVRRRQRPAPSLAEYLTKREREDSRGGEAGLLPLGHGGHGRAIRGATKSQRDELLAGQRSDGVVGNSQLHEELGGQLAEMSHRLKLNAIHFSNSLEAEKSLLDTSQQTLESNLTATQASKKHLGAVSSKGRGTTCLTLGVILVVLIIFVWTYMLIRFT